MRPLSKIKRGYTNVYYTNCDGTITFPLNYDYINFDTRINLDNAEYLEFSDIPFDSISTLRDLIQSGKLIKKSYIKPIKLDLRDLKEFTPVTILREKINALQREFEGLGVNISKRGLMFVVKNWRNGKSSAWRGEYFYICSRYEEGNDTMTISAIKLSNYFKSWQVKSKDYAYNKYIVDGIEVSGQ